MVVSALMMAVAFGATIVPIMTKNVVWNVVAFLPVPIFFLSCSPLCSLILGPCKELFKNFDVIFILIFCLLLFVLVYLGLTCGGCVLSVFSLPLIFICLVFEGLVWTVKKARECIIICKRVRWISGNKSQFDIQSPQPTAAPLAQV